MNELEAREDRKLWIGRAEAAARYRDDYGNQNERWQKNKHSAMGDHGNADAEGVDVNLIKPTMEILLGPFYTVHPRVMVTPLGGQGPGGGEQDAEATEVELNYWIRELELKSLMREFANDSEITNYAYCYVGHASSTDAKMSHEQHIRAGSPMIERISPWNILRPKGNDKLERCPWAGFEKSVPLSLAKELWPEHADKLQPDGRVYETESKTTLSESFGHYVKHDDNATITVYCIWDKENKRRLMFVGDPKIPMLEDKSWNPDETGGFPIIEMAVNQAPDEGWATPPMSYYRPQQIELNYARTKAKKRELRSRSRRYHDSELGAEFAAADRNDDDGASIPVENNQRANIPLRNLFHVEETQMPSNGAYAYGSIAASDLAQTAGIGPQQRSVGDPNAPTATASSHLEKWMAVRQSTRGDTIASFIVGIVRKVWMVLRLHPNVERDRLVPGDDGIGFRQIRYTLKQLRGQYRFELDVAAMIMDSPQVRITRAMGNYQLLRADPLVDPRRLILDLLEAQNKTDPQSYLLILKSPDEEYQRALQGLPVEADERDDHLKHIRAHEAQLQEVEQIVESTATAEFGGEEDPRRQRARLAGTLLMAHLNDHMRIVQQLQARSAGQQAPGEAQDQNALRQAVAAEDDQLNEQETPAELGGQRVVN